MAIGIGIGINRNRVLSNIDIWDGTIATSFGGGTGTQTNPYLITSGAEMAYLAQQVNSGVDTTGKYYEQTKNIDLKSLAWTPIGTDTSTLRFKGIFNGNGYYFSNLKVDSTTLSNRGLFGSVYFATVTAAVMSGYVRGVNDVGGVVGYAYKSVLVNCFNGANIYSPSTGTPSFHGGVVGRLTTNSTISNSYNFGSVNNVYRYKGGIVGYLVSASICEYCYSIGQVTTSNSLYGSIVGSNATSTVRYCYYNNQISLVGGINNADVVNQAEGKTTVQMKDINTYVNWDFATYWEYETGEYPKLFIYDL